MIHTGRGQDMRPYLTLQNYTDMNRCEHLSKPGTDPESHMNQTETAMTGDDHMTQNGT